MNTPSQREEALFEAALELPAAQRARYLREACGEDTALRQRLEILIGANDRAKEFLEHPAASDRGETFVLPLPRAERPGDRIGRYKLLQQIGEGGCGVVYMAEQEEPICRRVALKVIKLGMDTKQVIARFEAERQALARMDHPNIARVLDAGATETGRPYFVMELVRGIKITEYCDSHNLPTRERLDLFMQVCRAIQHAHQKGVIHRDIKPSNVLVTLHDGVPVPKVIDFGIAKATQGRLTNRTLFTALEQFVGTPAYMPPEQAEMSGLDIDTRSDIYSLGVLLYELLTGTTPFDSKQLVASGVDVMRRTLRETEPPRPSTRLHTMVEAELTTAAKHRQAEPAKLTSLMRGDLDWIVMKCLEKDRTRRYETANGLAMDIQRHLNNEPVVARPPSKLYRFHRLVRRNRLAFAAVAAVVVALATGLTLASLGLLQARAQRDQALAAKRSEQAQKDLADKARVRAEADEKLAQTEAARSRQVLQLLEKMLQGVDPSVALGRDPKMLREILDQTARSLGRDLTNQPEVEVELRGILADAYYALGSWERAGEQARERLRLAKAHSGERDLIVASALYQLGMGLWRLGQLEQAETFARRALTLRQTLAPNDDPDVADSLTCVANILESRGKRLGEAESMHQQALAMRRRLYGDNHPDVAASYNNLGNLFYKRHKLGEAESAYLIALAIRTNVCPYKHPDVAKSFNNLGNVFCDEHKLPQAEAMHREALKIRRQLLSYDHPDLAQSLNNLATVLKKEGNLAEAETLLRENLGNARKSYGYQAAALEGRVVPLTEDLEFGLVLMAWAAKLEGQVTSLTDVLISRRKYTEAAELFNDVLTPAVVAESQSAGLLAARGTLLARTGHWKEAAADFGKAIEFEPDKREHYHSLAPLLVERGDLDSYRQHCQRELAQFRQTKEPNTAEQMAKDCLILPDSGVEPAVVGAWADTAVAAGTNHWAWPHFQFIKGFAEYRHGAFANAVEWMHETLASEGEKAWRDAEAYAVLAMAQQQLSQAGEARAALARGLEIARTKMPQLESGDLEIDWLDWIIAHTLLREAQVLIEGGVKMSNAME